ncbi:MAG TPA: uroporphyrinogen-III synthase [Sphingomicrobium sp.]|nr:uroporphyrinogen-III synthase [Sphingomicrobium sp.]
MKRLLVLRPEPGASATVERARELGLDAFQVPLFEVEPVVWTMPDPRRFDALLLTSANAVRHGGEQLRQLRCLPVYAVGSVTAEAAAEAGFEIAGTGKGGIEDLLDTMKPGLRLLHLCGQDRRDSRASRQKIVPIVVYRSTPVEKPDLAGTAGAVAVIHSPRAGSRFASLVDDRASIAIAAVSPAAAEAAGTGWLAVEAAPRPNDDDLLALAARLCDKPIPE